MPNQRVRDQKVSMVAVGGLAGIVFAGIMAIGALKSNKPLAPEAEMPEFAPMQAVSVAAMPVLEVKKQTAQVEAMPAPIQELVKPLKAEAIRKKHVLIAKLPDNTEIFKVVEGMHTCFIVVSHFGPETRSISCVR